MDQYQLDSIVSEVSTTMLQSKVTDDVTVTCDEIGNDHYLFDIGRNFMFVEVEVKPGTAIEYLPGYYYDYGDGLEAAYFSPCSSAAEACTSLIDGLF